MDTYSSDGSKFQIWVPSTELFGDVGLVFVKVTGDSFWELNVVQSPYVVGLNKRNDFCEN